MVELKEKVIHSNTYDIDIRQYLTYAQIQQIVNAVEMASKEDDREDDREDDSWSARQTNIDMLVLLHATDIGKEKLEEVGHEMFVISGLMDCVRDNVINIDEVYNALDYTESLTRAGYKLLKDASKVVKTDTFKAAMKNYGK